MKKIIIERFGEYQHTAMVENGRIVDLLVDSDRHRSIAGNIYLGVVKNILPSQFAFIDIGQTKNGFLNLDDPAHVRCKIGRPILVQARKDPSGEKGASLSTRLDLTGRLIVIFESQKGEIGVSHKIKNERERERLRKAARLRLPEGFGAILRTDSEYKEEEAIEADLDKLTRVYREIREKGPLYKPPALIYQESTALSELLREDVEEIIVCDPAQLYAVTAEAENCLPGGGGRVRLEERGFSADLTRQIAKALEKKIWLDCGGDLTIEQTEACVIIDVNSGKFTGRKNRRDSILKTNLEAAREAAVQIRLRNLTGMIIIDFINMEAKEDQKKLYAAFSAEIARDRIKTNIIGMTELGLMQLTRRKTRESLNRILSRECPVCHGTGFLPPDAAY